MDLFELYSHLQGSHGAIRLRLSQDLLDQFCNLIRERYGDRVKELRIVVLGKNRFRIYAELTNWFYQFLGSLALLTLRDDGIEIKIDEPDATRQSPAILGTMDTTFFGKEMAIPKIVELINESVDEPDAVIVTNTKWVSLTRFRVFVSMNPFRILRNIIPREIARHIKHFSWQATDGAFLLDLTWRHTGAKKTLASPVLEKKDG